MPNLAHLLKQEISRLTRREIKRESAQLKKTAAIHRREIAALKRQIAALERISRTQSKRLAKSTPAAEEPDTVLRFRADGFKTLRKKLGLSAEQMAKLLGVSAQSVYAWETKRSTPRRAQLPAIAELRSIGKREAVKRLEAIG